MYVLSSFPPPFFHPSLFSLQFFVFPSLCSSLCCTLVLFSSNIFFLLLLIMHTAYFLLLLLFVPLVLFLLWKYLLLPFFAKYRFTIGYLSKISAISGVNVAELGFFPPLFFPLPLPLSFSSPPFLPFTLPLLFFVFKLIYLPFVY